VYERFDPGSALGSKGLFTTGVPTTVYDHRAFFPKFFGRNYHYKIIGRKTKRNYALV